MSWKAEMPSIMISGAQIYVQFVIICLYMDRFLPSCVCPRPFKILVLAELGIHLVIVDDIRKCSMTGLSRLSHVCVTSHFNLVYERYLVWLCSLRHFPN